MITKQNSEVNRKFVIEIFDPETGSIKADYEFGLKDVAMLCKIIDPDSSDITPGVVYHLEMNEVEKIKQEFGIAFKADDLPSGIDVTIRSWRISDGLPYKVHTNRELFLMLKNEKPFAAFTEYWPNNTGYEYIPEKYFQPYVTAGLFEKREYIDISTSERKTRFVFFAAKGQEWRIDAYILLNKVSQKVGWNEGFERMQGTLLGYDDSQNDIYIETIYRPSLR